MRATAVDSDPTLAFASLLDCRVVTPGFASLHPGLYAVARIRELTSRQSRSHLKN